MKREYPTVTKKPVHMSTLRRSLLVLAGLPLPRGLASPKLPKDMEGTFHNVALMSNWGDILLGYFTIVVVKSKPPTHFSRNKSSQHRIFIKIGDRLIPAGRAAQAKA